MSIYPYLTIPYHLIFTAQNSLSLLLMQEYRPQTVIEHHEGERPEGIDAFEHGTLLKLNQENSAWLKMKKKQMAVMILKLN